MTPAVYRCCCWLLFNLYFFSHIPLGSPRGFFCACVCVGAAVEISFIHSTARRVRCCRYKIQLCTRRSYTCCCQAAADLREEQTWESCYLFYFLFLRQPPASASSPHTRNSSLAVFVGFSGNKSEATGEEAERERERHKQINYACVWILTSILKIYLLRRGARPLSF